MAITLTRWLVLVYLDSQIGAYTFSQYRDFVFRQMFYAMKGCKSDSVAQEKRLSTLSELCQLQDSSYAMHNQHILPRLALLIIRFFLSRTVAAEVLMECITNTVAYDALNALGNEGQLKFDLLYVRPSFPRM